MNKSFAAVWALAIALAGCNDKLPESPQLGVADSTVETPADTSTLAALSEFEGDLNALGEVELCALDAVNGQGAKEGRFNVSASERVVLEGWAATSSLTNPGTVAVVLSDANKAFAISGKAGVARGDVAEAYKINVLTNAGFRLELPSLQIPPSEYDVSVLHDEAGAQISCSTPLKIIVQ